MDYRTLGRTGIEVSEVALGCWPIAGLTSPGTNEADSLATIRACFELGINHLDTAYCYGRDGESERCRAEVRRRPWGGVPCGLCVSAVEDDFCALPCAAQTRG